jgi:hypothetical protein
VAQDADNAALGSGLSIGDKSLQLTLDALHGQ